MSGFLLFVCIPLAFAGVIIGTCLLVRWTIDWIGDRFDRTPPE